MKQRKQRATGKLEHVRRDFETWRKQRRKGERIPERLWTAAAGLVPEYGLSRVSGSLRLDYSRLRKLSERVGPDPGLQTEPGILFAELAEPASSAETVCVVELEKSNGTRMRMALAERAVVDWDRLTDAFLKA